MEILKVIFLLTKKQTSLAWNFIMSCVLKFEKRTKISLPEDAMPLDV